MSFLHVKRHILHQAFDFEEAIATVWQAMESTPADTPTAQAS
jgi:hypothetical protein